MSIPTLIAVYDEMRRLAIAGSAVAAGDFRLKKLIPPLEKSGEKAPVFAKVAQAVTAVVDSSEKTASAALLELTTLVNAILYTQGETGIAGDLLPLETIDLGGQSRQMSARILKPLLEALRSTGSGRMELIRDAFEQGTFTDLRLVKPALYAIDDPYSEIGKFMAERVLPLYGKAILPELRAKLDIKGRAGHVHRLQLMHQLDAEASRDVIRLALAEGSKEIRVAAIECLGGSSEDVAFLLEQSQAKATNVRVAALRALAASGAMSAEVIRTLKDVIDSLEIASVIDAIRKSPLPEIHNYVLAQADAVFAELLQIKNKDHQGVAVTRLQHLVACLDERTDTKAEPFLLKVFEHAGKLEAIKSEPSGTDLNELIARVLARGTMKMQKALVASHKTLKGGSLPPAMFAARIIMAPAAFYDEFNGLLKAIPEKRTKKTSEEQDRATALLGVLGSVEEQGFYRVRIGDIRYVPRQTDKPLQPLDPRWLDAAVSAGSVALVAELARPGHAAANRFLSEHIALVKEPYAAQHILRTMVRIGHPEAADTMIAMLKALAKQTTHYYAGYWYGRLIVELPKSSAAKFEELLPTLPDKMVDQLLESVMALKNKPD
jgi:hypothetical protein